MIVCGEKVYESDREAEMVDFPPYVKYIGALACFWGKLAVLSIESTNIVVIGKHAFSNCFGMQNVMFPASLEEICEGAFKSCKKLENIMFPNDSKLKIIGPKAFYNCSKLESFAFPPLLEVIGEKSFKKCSNLININLCETNIKQIGQNAFFNQSATLLLPPTVSITSVIENSFSRIIIDHPVIKPDDCGYYIANNNAIISFFKRSKHILVRRGVELISKNCFCFSQLISITIPSSVIEIGELAFGFCVYLKAVNFKEDSRLIEIKKGAFNSCSMKTIRFPRSLKILRKAFCHCKNLEKVIFPHDSKLEIIESAFSFTNIKHLALPPSIKVIKYIHTNMPCLESIFIKNDLYESNEDRTAVFSKDGSKLICAIGQYMCFIIPDGVRVVKRKAFQNVIFTKIVFPASVEVIEDDAFHSFKQQRGVEFAEGSRLKSVRSLPMTDALIINNENFITKENGVVMSLNPRGIVFVPNELIELKIDPDVEIIYSNAFIRSKIKQLFIPKSMKNIFRGAFVNSRIESLIFEEGTVLDYAEFSGLYYKTLKIPLVKDYLEFGLLLGYEILELPPNFAPKQTKIRYQIFTNNHSVKKIIVPKSSTSWIASLSVDKFCIHGNLVIK